MKYKLTPLTPIHIGDGKQLYPYEYIIKHNRLYKINLKDIIKNLDKEKQKRINTLIMENNLILFRDYLNKIYDESLGYISKIKVSNEVYDLYNDKIGGSSKFNEQNQLLIDSFINSNNVEYIAGSSIKGAIRTCLLYEVAYNKGDLEYEVIKDKKGRIVDFKGNKDILNHKQKVSGDIVEKKYFGHKSVQDDIFKSLKISDSFGELSTCVFSCEIFTKKQNELKKGVPTYMICCEGKLQNNFVESVEGKISINENLSKNNNFEISLENIIKSANNRTEDILNDELNFYECDENITEIYNKLYDIFENKKDNQILIRLGKGCGFNTTTLNLAIQDEFLRNKNSSRSRTLAQGYPMGWALIEFEI